MTPLARHMVLGGEGLHPPRCSWWEAVLAKPALGAQQPSQAAFALPSSPFRPHLSQDLLFPGWAPQGMHTWVESA